MPRILCTLLLLALCACERAPISYPPPEQRPAVEGPAPDPAYMMVEMSDAGSSAHYVKDIEPGEGWWRWTGQQPTVKILAFTTRNMKLVADFAVWETAFAQTGPVELSFFVNDQILDKVQYKTPGNHHFEKAIPADLLRTDVESTASIAIDKLYTAPLDGKKFGFILTRIGFVPE